MIKRIIQHPIDVKDKQVVLLPKGAKILAVQPQLDKLFLWVLADPKGVNDTPVTIRIFGIYSDIHNSEALQYIGIFSMYDSFLVFHAFLEKRNDKRTMKTDNGHKKVYISGAIAHCNLADRKAAFAAAEQQLKQLGLDPVNPFKNGLGDEAHRTAHMRADIALLLDCDYIYLLRGWEHSKGAKLELDVASSCGITVLFE